MQQPMDDLMARIDEGMKVYDSTGKEIGTVKYVQMGDEDPTNLEVETATDQRPRMRENSLVENIADAFTPDEDIPEEMVARLRRYGYIRIDAGLLKSDRFATHDQIVGVNQDRVTLNAAEDSLLKS